MNRAIPELDESGSMDIFGIMAAAGAPILCVPGNDREAREFQNALAAMRICNPLRCVVGAAEAIEALEDSARNGEVMPVLVFLSLAAPEANRLAAWFEAHPTRRPTGVIAMTGFTDMRPVIQAYHLGVTAFLEWPLKEADVQNALRSNPNLRIGEIAEGVVVEAAKEL